MINTLDAVIAAEREGVNAKIGAQGLRPGVVQVESESSGLLDPARLESMVVGVTHVRGNVNVMGSIDLLAEKRALAQIDSVGMVVSKVVGKWVAQQIMAHIFGIGRHEPGDRIGFEQGSERSFVYVDEVGVLEAGAALATHEHVLAVVAHIGQFQQGPSLELMRDSQVPAIG
jgi:hypothetical protein